MPKVLSALGSVAASQNFRSWRFDCNYVQFIFYLYFTNQLKKKFLMLNILTTSQSSSPVA